MKSAKESLEILGSKGIKFVDVQLDESCSEYSIDNLYDAIVDALDVYSTECEASEENSMMIMISAEEPEESV